MQVVLYTRVSTERQANEGVSLEAQLARLNAYAVAHGHEVIGTFCDAGISGKSTKNRPEFLKALALACSKKALLVFYSLSRISRSTRDLMEIAEKVKAAGAGLVSLQESIDTSTAMGNFLFTILSALCALERELIAERTRGALAHMKSNGQKTGGHLPYGYSVSDEGKLVEDPFEQRMIRSMSLDRDGAGRSFQQVADKLNSLKVPTRTGAPWSGKVVRDILKARKGANR